MKITLVKVVSVPDSHDISLISQLVNHLDSDIKNIPYWITVKYNLN